MTATLPPVPSSMFHLAFPIADLAAARAFYVDVLGGRVGRTTPHWIDVLLWGAQITLHERPEQVLDRAARGVRHFGAVLSWLEWELLAERLTPAGVAFASPPRQQHIGTPREEAKLLLEDPSGNLIEVKAYRDPAAVFG